MRTYVSVTLRNVAVLRNSENLAGQRSYVILLRGRRVEPGSVRRRPGPSAMVVEKDIVGPSAYGMLSLLRFGKHGPISH